MSVDYSGFCYRRQWTGVDKCIARFSLLAGLFLTAACGRDHVVVCPSILMPALRVDVADSVTNQAVPVALVIVGLADSAHRDSLPARFSVDVFGGPGVYALRIESIGYQPWTSTVLVGADGSCHRAKRVDVRARLKPQP